MRSPTAVIASRLYCLSGEQIRENLTNEVLSWPRKVVTAEIVLAESFIQRCHWGFGETGKPIIKRPISRNYLPIAYSVLLNLTRTGKQS